MFLIDDQKDSDATNEHDDKKTEKKENTFQDDQKKDYSDKPKIETWLTEKEYKAIVAVLKSNDPDKIRRGRDCFDDYCILPKGMKKIYKDEIELILKDFDKEARKLIANKQFDN